MERQIKHRKVIDVTKPWRKKIKEVRDLGHGILAEGTPWKERQFDRVEKPKGL
jgi:hypothetical protein